MLKSTTQFRLIFLANWKPPAGVMRCISFDDNGIIDVYLDAGPDAGPVGDVLTLMPDVPMEPVVYRALDELAAGLLDAAEVVADRHRQDADERHRRQAEDLRVARALKAARRRFDDGIRKATS